MIHLTLLLLSSPLPSLSLPFTGSGTGDAPEWLAALTTAFETWRPNPLLQDATQLYNPAWNAFVEGPTWGAWWTQNSYGPSFAALPFLQEPHLTWLNNCCHPHASIAPLHCKLASTLRALVQLLRAPRAARCTRMRAAQMALERNRKPFPLHFGQILRRRAHPWPWMAPSAAAGCHCSPSSLLQARLRMLPLQP